MLVDTCVLADLADPASEWYEWSVATLEGYDQDFDFVINPIIYSEISVGLETIEEVEDLIDHLKFEVRNIPKEAFFLAGKAFKNYRKNKGTKTNVLPDFFIGSHATIEKMALITRDDRRFSHYFPKLQIIKPKRR